MKYKELKEILDSKNISLKEFCDIVGYTRAGLTRAIDNETVELRKLKMICETARISPAQFFESGTFGIMQNTPTSNKKEVEALKKEIEYLKSQIRDKNELLALYREKGGTPYGVVAEPQSKFELISKKR